MVKRGRPVSQSATVAEPKQSRSDEAEFGELPIITLQAPDRNRFVFRPSGLSVAQLAILSRHDAIWERICDSLSGDALTTLAKVLFFKRATMLTPAFQLLSGINNNAKLIPWEDDDNVLAATFTPHPLNTEREDLAARIVLPMMNALHYPVYLQHCHDGPMRNSSPVATFTPTASPDSVYLYIWNNENRMRHRQETADAYSLRPSVFGIRPGFSYSPFWDLLIDDGSDSFFDDDGTHFTSDHFHGMD